MGIKKKNVTNLIRAYSENNDKAFRDEAYKIACIFSEDGDSTIAEYIISLLSESTSLLPQIGNFIPESFRILPQSSESLFLPDEISKDLLAVSHLLENRQSGLNKFIFVGAPGTGKTEAVKQLGRIMHREVFSVDFSQIIDSRLGQTAKNICKLFDDINIIRDLEKIIIIFDEVDSIALDRVNMRDHREMGRATTEFLKGLDKMDPRATIIATTNLEGQLDSALLRRFDMMVNFNRYAQGDLSEIAVRIMLAELKKQHKKIDGIQKIAKKYFNFLPKLPNPGELKNSIRVAVALCDTNNPSSLFSEIVHRASIANNPTERELRDSGFTIREIETITGIPRSSLSRKLKEE